MITYYVIVYAYYLALLLGSSSRLHNMERSEYEAITPTGIYPSTHRYRVFC